MRSSYSLRTALAGAAALVLLALAAAQPARGADTRYVRVTLLHTNDMHGHVLPADEPGGLARIATVVRRIRQEEPNVLLLDSGDTIHGTPEEKAFTGKPILDAMNALGYAAAAAGNHEFDFGQAVTRAAIRRARFPILSANVLDERTRQPWGGFRPYVIREVAGLRVALFGLTTPFTVSIEWPRTLAGIRFADPVATARELVPRLRTEERADVVIALTHLGVQPDRELAATVPGIDFILGGHSHTELSKQVWVNDTLIAQTGALARNLGRVDFIVRKDGEAAARVVDVNGRNGRWWRPTASAETAPAAPLIPMRADVPLDPEVTAAYRPYADRLRPHLEERLTRAAEPLPAEGTLKRETALGDLLADAVRHHAKTDVALFSSAHAEKGLPSGEIRTRDLYTVMGAYTRQHIVVVRVPGAGLRNALALAVRPGQVKAQVSGVRLSGAAVQVGDQPLDDGRTYTVAAAAHIIQEFLLSQAGVEVLEDDVRAPTVRDAAIAYLRGHAPLANRADGRLGG